MSDSEKIAEYRNAIQLATVAARVLSGIDIPAILQAMRRADDLGPILDPTLWRDKQKAMDEDRKLLNAALPLHQIGKMIVERFPDGG